MFAVLLHEPCAMTGDTNDGSRPSARESARVSGAKNGPWLTRPAAPAPIRPPPPATVPGHRQAPPSPSRAKLVLRPGSTVQSTSHPRAHSASAYVVGPSGGELGADFCHLPGHHIESNERVQRHDAASLPCRELNSGTKYLI